MNAALQTITTGNITETRLDIQYSSTDSIWDWTQHRYQLQVAISPQQGGWRSRSMQHKEKSAIRTTERCDE